VDDKLDDIARRMQADEEVAFGEFADAVGPKLYRHYCYQGLSAADAESLSVSVVSDIVLKIDDFASRGPGSFRSWVYKVADNTLHEQFRRRRPDLFGDASVLAAPPAGNENGWEREAELEQAVSEAIGELALLDRKIVLARLEDPDETFAEIGKKVDLEPGTTRVRYHRALKKLAHQLEDQPAVKRWKGRLRGAQN
jgi:RNA polymerase sigma factor (sigma-70 family)